MRRRLSALTCISLAAFAAAVPADAACARATTARWVTAKPPLVPHGTVHQTARGSNLKRFRAIGLDAKDPRVLFVTDGGHVQRSNDGGCTWAQVFELPGAPSAPTPDGDVSEIRSIDVTRIGTRTRVLLAVQRVGWDYPAAVDTVVVRSDDGYGGWTVVSDPVTFAGVFDYRRGAPWPPVVRSVGNVAYVAVPSPDGAVRYLRSTDGGRTWSAPGLPADPKAPVLLRSFAVNPWNPDELWEWGGGWARDDSELPGLRYSTNGGASWVPVNPWPYLEDKRGFYDADVAWPRRGGPARVLVLGEGASNDGDNPMASWSGDGGRTFHLAVPPLRSVDLMFSQVTHLPGGDAVVVTGGRQPYRIVHRGRPPRGSDWKPLPRPPDRPAVTSYWFNALHATATSPTLLVQGNVTELYLLVAR